MTEQPPNIANAGSIDRMRESNGIGLGSSERRIQARPIFAARRGFRAALALAPM